MATTSMSTTATTTSPASALNGSGNGHHDPAATDPVASVDPRIIGTQQTFRVALAAMTTPGRIGQLAWEPELSDQIAGPDRWLAALLLALADHEVSLAVELADRSATVSAEIGRWTRAATATPDTADMVVAEAATIESGLPARLRRGSLQYPDDAALLIIQVGRLGADASGGTDLSLEGPGVDGRISLRVDDLGPALIASRDVAVSQYPTGIDLLLVDRDGRIAGIPRTTVIAVAVGEEG